MSQPNGSDDNFSYNNPNNPYGPNRYSGNPVPPPFGYGGPYRNGPRPHSFRTVLKIALIVILCGVMLMMILGTIVGGLFSSVAAVLVSQDKIGDTVSEKTLSGSANSPYKVAVLPIEGTITENEDGFVRKAIRTAYEDTKVKAVVLRVNSPGGTISGSDYYYTLLKKVKEERHIPIIVSMGPIAASGGYYVSMAGDKIYAERSTMTGSIGVICMLFNAAGLCEKIGVGMNNIVSGPNKGMGDFTKPMSDDERKIWQGVVDDAYAQFLSVIRAGRTAFAETDAQIEGKTLEQIADGRIYTASEAKALGLIDKIGFLDDAVNEALNQAGIQQAVTQVVRYKKSEGLAELLLSETESESKTAQKRLGSLAEAAASPALYYLAPGALPVQDR